MYGGARLLTKQVLYEENKYIKENKKKIGIYLLALFVKVIVTL